MRCKHCGDGMHYSFNRGINIHTDGYAECTTDRNGYRTTVAEEDE